MLLPRILFYALSSILLSYPLAKTVTRYIDDSYGDLITGSRPKYHPTDSTVWKNQTCGTAQGCYIVFDPQQSYNRTYTAATYGTRTNSTSIGFSFSFQGTSISVYFILANGNYLPGTTTRTECNFILNGSLEGSYAWDEPPDKKGAEYNVEVFRKEGLENWLHTLNVETGTYPYDVYVAFDYAMYTVEEPDETTSDNRNGSTAALPSRSSESNLGSPSKGASTGAIIGGVIGGLALIAGALLVLFVFRRKRRDDVAKHSDGSDKHTIPFMGRPTTPELHQTDNTPEPRSTGSISTSFPPVAFRARLPNTRTASYTFDSYHDAGDTVSELEALRSGTDDQSPAPISASGVSTKESNSLLRLSQQLDQMREEWWSLESQGKRNHGDYYAPSDSGTSRSEILQSEMSELREQIRALQAQVLRQKHELAVVNTSPPAYTP
ncbi:hypothetical protein AAF712_010457 [Marasmius tenuissimus]|uniref:Uncharacterized protein n=1 Tax=Marasmius tenuissimus TaxID=585030 RepID=A0ABR2ZMR3_9AGAR